MCVRLDLVIIILIGNWSFWIMHKSCLFTHWLFNFFTNFFTDYVNVFVTFSNSFKKWKLDFNTKTQSSLNRSRPEMKHMLICVLFFIRLENGALRNHIGNMNVAINQKKKSLGSKKNSCQRHFRWKGRLTFLGEAGWLKSQSRHNSLFSHCNLDDGEGHFDEYVFPANTSRSEVQYCSKILFCVVRCWFAFVKSKSFTSQIDIVSMARPFWIMLFFSSIYVPFWGVCKPARQQRVWQCLCTLLGQLPHQPTWEIASLPLFLGGLGLRSASRTAHAAYWGSWADCLHTIRQRHSMVADTIAHALVSPPSSAVHLVGASTSREVLLSVDFRCPSWQELLHGLRPEHPPIDGMEPGVPIHSWQFFAASCWAPFLGVAQTLSDRTGVDEITVESHVGIAIFFFSVIAIVSFCPTAVPHSSPPPSLAPSPLLLAPAGVAVHSMYLATTAQRVRDQGCWGAGGSVQSAARVCREAGARVSTNLFMRDLDLPVGCRDGRRLEVVADGLPLFNGAQLAIDTTLVSPIRGDGQPRPGCAAHAVRHWQWPGENKRRTYPELSGQHGRARLVVLAAEVGGRWSAESRGFINQLAKGKARSVPRILSGRARQAWQHRWSSMLACAAARAFALCIGAPCCIGLGWVTPSTSEVVAACRHLPVCGDGWGWLVVQFLSNTILHSDPLFMSSSGKKKHLCSARAVNAVQSLCVFNGQCETKDPTIPTHTPSSFCFRNSTPPFPGKNFRRCRSMWSFLDCFWNSPRDFKGRPRRVPVKVCDESSLCTLEANVRNQFGFPLANLERPYSLFFNSSGNNHVFEQKQGQKKNLQQNQLALFFSTVSEKRMVAKCSGELHAPASSLIYWANATPSGRKSRVIRKIRKLLFSTFSPKHLIDGILMLSLVNLWWFGRVEQPEKIRWGTRKAAEVGWPCFVRLAKGRRPGGGRNTGLHSDASRRRRGAWCVVRLREDSEGYCASAGGYRVWSLVGCCVCRCGTWGTSVAVLRVRVRVCGGVGCLSGVAVLCFGGAVRSGCGLWAGRGSRLRCGFVFRGAVCLVRRLLGWGVRVCLCVGEFVGETAPSRWLQLTFCGWAPSLLKSSRCASENM